MINKEKLQKPKAPNLFEIMTADPLEMEELNFACKSEIFKNTDLYRFILGIYTVEERATEDFNEKAEKAAGPIQAYSKSKFT